MNRRLLSLDSVGAPKFMMDDRGVHAMIGCSTICGTGIVDFDPEYGPLQEVGTTTVTCDECLKVICQEDFQAPRISLERREAA